MGSSILIYINQNLWPTQKQEYYRLLVTAKSELIATKISSCYLFAPLLKHQPFYHFLKPSIYRNNHTRRKAKMVDQKRFALFLATSDSAFVKKTNGGYFNVFVSTFGEEGEQWDLFRVIDGEFPEEKDLDKYDGFVISGSLHDAFGEADWIVKLCSLCQKLDDMKKKILGICFGHQVLTLELFSYDYSCWFDLIRKIHT